MKHWWGIWYSVLGVSWQLFINKPLLILRCWKCFLSGEFSWNFKHLFGILLVQCSCWVTSMVKCLLVLSITSYHPPVCFQNLHLALNLGLRGLSRMERVQVSWSGFKAIFIFSGVKTLRKSISRSSACNRKQLSWVQDF